MLRQVHQTYRPDNNGGKEVLGYTKKLLTKKALVWVALRTPLCTFIPPYSAPIKTLPLFVQRTNDLEYI